MTNFIFKSANRLIKNSPITIEALDRRLGHIQVEQRHQRQDLSDIKRMLNKVLIDKHLQHQVDDYFEDDPEDTPTDESKEID